jgi:phosphoribosylpyrophosphate synthetase
MELLIMCYACKTSSCSKVIGVIPYMPYSRQSKSRGRGRGGPLAGDLPRRCPPRLPSPTPNSHAYLTVSPSARRDVNNVVMETLIMAYACKTSTAKSVTGVIPYFPYSKQCREFFFPCVDPTL